MLGFRILAQRAAHVRAQTFLRPFETNFPATASVAFLAKLLLTNKRELTKLEWERRY